MLINNFIIKMYIFFSELNHNMPKLLFPSLIAIINLFSKIYFEEYSGRSNVLKLNKI